MSTEMRWTVRIVSIKPGLRDEPPLLKNLLEEGWEPFAVTWDGEVWDYHLRKFI